VWAALNDTTILRAAIPGCRQIVWRSASTLDIEVQVRLGLIHPVLGGELELSGVAPAERYTLTGRGHGRFLGLAHASADVSLTDVAEGTELVFSAHGSADGPVMKLGKALIGDRAQWVIDGFFERIGAAMGAPVIALGAPEAPAG
jgi:carbon monoxide dehydrogenase subunit G